MINQNIFPICSVEYLVISLHGHVDICLKSPKTAFVMGAFKAVKVCAWSQCTHIGIRDAIKQY